MKKNKKNIPTGKQGFTLIELLLIMGIIILLVSVMLISMMSGRDKAADNSTFSAFKSVAAPAYMCLSNGSGAVRLTEPVAGNNICNVPLNDTNWPLIKSGWSLNDFSWCPVNYALTTPPSSCGAYNFSSCGGNSSSGDFCFSLNKGSKHMWCTLEGCRKEGF